MSTRVISIPLGTTLEQAASLFKVCGMLTWAHIQGSMGGFHLGGLHGTLHGRLANGRHAYERFAWEGAFFRILQKHIWQRKEI